MGAITYTADLQLGIPDEVRETAQAYLVVMLENNSADAARRGRRGGSASC